MARPLLSGTFWLDTLERVVRTFIASVLGVLTVSGWPNPKEWSAIGIATAVTLGLAILASGVGEPGTASVMNPAPPDTLKDRGSAAIEVAVLTTGATVIVLAVWVLTRIFGWSLG